MAAPDLFVLHDMFLESLDVQVKTSGAQTRSLHVPLRAPDAFLNIAAYSHMQGLLMSQAHPERPTHSAIPTAPKPPKHLITLRLSVRPACGPRTCARAPQLGSFASRSGSCDPLR